ncbi:GNAT family N-acetyltransferase [Ureibacillus chungkukjangi]|uniref:GNAT family N-acetyltransferase n=1 Tax=Ureibacillus chungkukjangi TaxID=1202712 RepID=UPI00203C5A2A|nr:GNAT family protein [Ureibacillus chungkukjangi]MCM3387025.1 GNAT family N-acetyltransferase [Ureibacillus chungkukjangi]
MYLESNRLLIRKFSMDDVQEVSKYTSSPVVMRYMPEGVMNEEETKKLVLGNMGENPKKFAVILKNENILIGHMEFFRYFGEHTYEIGWVFNPDYYNRGFATEAAQVLLNFGFTDMKLHRIIATCQPENIPSYRIMEKLGMRREGYFKKCIPCGEEWWDEYFYAILAEEWVKR